MRSQAKARVGLSPTLIPSVALGVWVENPNHPGHAVRRLLKFLHTLGAIGMMGAMASLLIGLGLAPSSPAGEADVLLALARIATWVLLPSLALTLLAGLLAIAVTPGFHDAGWVWIKAATGLLIFEGGLHALGPIQDAGKTGAGAPSGHLAPAMLAQSFSGERNTLWLLMAVALANVALGVWRPRIPRYPV
jgi:hypothetical protein